MSETNESAPPSVEDDKASHPNYPFEAPVLTPKERLLEISAALKVASPSGVETLADEVAVIAQSLSEQAPESIEMPKPAEAMHD